MKYTFDNHKNRRSTNSLKWDVPSNVLPMWVADMDFETAPEIIEDLHKRVDHGIFGYNIVPQTYYEAIQTWWKEHHKMIYDTNWMMFCTGVVPAITSIIKNITSIDDQVLIQAPVYNIFYNSILNHGRKVISSDLRYENKEYTIDFQDLEEKLAHPKTTMMLLCNPHNPIGKLWDEKTLQAIGHLCVKHHVIVVSDEIHCDIVQPGNKYIPFASVSNENLMNSITCVSPSKAFNLAGLQTASIIVANDELRYRVNRGINSDEVAEPNSFAIQATISAYQKGANWLKQLNVYIEENKQFVIHYLEQHLPQLQVVPSKATYLLWVDCANISSDTTQLACFLKESHGIYITEGSSYGDVGKTFIRMNIACPRVDVMDGTQRLCLGIQEYLIQNKKATLESFRKP